jgi:hypothetical protein
MKIQRKQINDWIKGSQSQRAQGKDKGDGWNGGGGKEIWLGDKGKIITVDEKNNKGHKQFDNNISTIPAIGNHNCNVLKK